MGLENCVRAGFEECVGVGLAVVRNGKWKVREIAGRVVWNCDVTDDAVVDGYGFGGVASRQL
jgi:hypothetical protein